MIPYRYNAYYCFSEKGEVLLPTLENIYSLIEEGLEPVIFLDSCVCLHIIRVIDFGKTAKNVDLSKIIYLKEYLNRHPIEINPFFGLLELCYRKDGFDNEKFWDFKCRIDFFREIPVKHFKRFNYDFHRDFYVLKNTKPDLTISYEILESALNNSYCALLKIRELATKSLSKTNATKNLDSFVDWMINDLDILMGIEYKLAMYVFGGRTEFRKMIGLDCSGVQVQKKVMGTVWDIFHSKNTSNNFRLNQILDKNLYATFMTNDLNLFKIFQKFNLRVIKDGENIISSSFLFNSDSDCPHFDDQYLEKQNERFLNLFIERRNRKYEFNRNRIASLIEQLEKSIN